MDSQRYGPCLPDMRRLRGLLAEAQISHTAYAATCGMSRRYVSRLLGGHIQPGELATIKMQRGLAALGLSDESEARHAEAS
jgi:predicted transcriptional regulator